MSLNLKPNIKNQDDFYQELIDMHRNLNDDQSLKVNAKLILLLANHIGDAAVLSEAMKIACEDIDDAQAA